jgi:succinate dehydrogenase / fumarate reductase membrane anchor subunit
VSLLCKVQADHATVAAWVSVPYVTVLLLALSIALFWHLMLGVQVVIEDYIHCTTKQIMAQLLLRAFAGLGALLAVVSILKISLGTH